MLNVPCLIVYGPLDIPDCRHTAINVHTIFVTTRLPSVMIWPGVVDWASGGRWFVQLEQHIWVASWGEEAGQLI